MRYTQLVNFELSPACPYQKQHAFCPATKRSMQVGWPSRRTKPSQIIEAICDLPKFGFRGLVGFHFYSDPMCSAVMPEILRAVRFKNPEQRFMCWTNADNFVEKHENLRGFFDLIILSLYDENSPSQCKRAGRNAREICPNVQSHPQHDDLRADPPSEPPPEGKICLRPFTELSFDACGDVRMCCHDFLGPSAIGNLIDDPLRTIVERWTEARRNLFVGPEGRPEMHQSAPERCLKCAYRYGWHGWVASIMHDAKNYAVKQVKPPGA